MKKLHESKKSSRFEEPDGIVKVKICKKTGLKATKKCSDTTYELCREDAIPEDCDHGSNAVKICEESGKLATEYCPDVITEYFGNSLPPKERLGLWSKSSGDDSVKAPTEECPIHTEENQDDEDLLPTIKLRGSSTVTLTVGATYVERGATAKDKRDGNLTDKIEISGNVNTSKAGTYKVTYSVTNSVDKTATVTRTVIVKEKNTPTPKPNTNTNTTNTNSSTNTNTNTNTANTTNTTPNTNTTNTIPSTNTTNTSDENSSSDDDDDDT